MVYLLGMKLKALKAAFPYTIPILTGYAFLGMALGIYMNAAGFSFIYPLMTSTIVYGGSLEFVVVEMLLSPFAPVSVFIMALLVQARHLFYGLSMLDKFKGVGLKKYYLIYAMSDETFSLNCGIEAPKDVDQGWFMFFIALLDQMYWIIATITGCLLGSLLNINTEGISFVMTAMFVVIFLDRWLKDKNHISAIVGILVSLICLIIFGSSSFMIPTMISIITILYILRKAKVLS